MQPIQTAITLKHMELSPEHLTANTPTQLKIIISQHNSSTMNNYSHSGNRKFIFLLEETDQETPPLAEKQEYLFQDILLEVGTYHLQCLNYPKIKSTISVVKQQAKEQVEPAAPLSPRMTTSPLELQDMEEIQEEKQEETKEGCEDDTKQGGEEHLEHSHSRSDYAEYEKILSSGEETQYDTLPNKYLKYFKEEFKLWRDFFEQPEPKPQKQIKEKYGSQREEKLSASSLSLEEKQTEKEESVISRLRSHQEISDFQEQELSHPKTMKKTTSEACFHIERQVQKTYVSSTSKKRHFFTTTSSPHQRTQQSEGDGFIEWACSWTFEKGCEQVRVERRNDHHLSRQWFTYLHNKFKISEFMYG